MANLVSHWAEMWLKYTVAVLWRSALVIGVVWIVARLARKRSATFRYALWMLVLVRLVLPTGLSSPVSVGTFGARLMTRFVPADQLSTAREEVSVQQPPVLETVQPPATMIEEVGTPEIGMAVPLAEDGERWPVPVARDTKALPPAVNGRRLSLVPALFLVWVTGVLLFSVVILWRFRALRRCLRSAEPIVSGAVHRLFSRCCEHIPMLHALSPGLYLSASLSSPFVAGIVRPRIVMPHGLIDSSSEAELEPLILHELVHVRRWDILVNWIQVVLQLLHWYNPLVWLANREIRRERELACDDRVLVATGYRRKEYGSSLLKIAALTPRRAVLSLGMVGVAEPGDSLKLRLKRIMDAKRRISSRLTILSLASVVFIGAVVLPARPAQQKTVPSQSAIEGSENLRGNGTVSGRVLMPDGSPAAGALVKAVRWAAFYEKCEPARSLRVEETRTGDEGSFAFGDVPVGRYSLVAAAGGLAGHVPAYPGSKTVPSDNIRIILKPARSIAGQVTDPGGAAIKDVTIIPLLVRKGPIPPLMVSTVTTGPDGRFEITDVEEDEHGGEYALALFADGFAPKVVENVALGARDLHITLTAGKSISGTVTFAGKPEPEITIIATTWFHRFFKPFKARTDQQGSYTLSGLDRGTYFISIDDEQFTAPTKEDVNLGAGRDLTGIDFAVARTGVLIGKVTDARTGDPVSGISFRLRRKEDVGSRLGEMFLGIERDEVCSDSHGRFRVAPLQPGVYKVTPEDAGDYVRLFADDVKELTVQEGRETAVQYRLKRGATATVTVRNESGEAITGATVGAVLLDRDTSVYRHGDLPSGIEQSDGRYRLRGLPVGRFLVEAGTDSSFLKDRVIFEVTSGQDSPEVAVTLNKKRTVTGRVVDPGGRGIPGARLDWWGAVTREDGTFTAELAPDRDNSVYIRADGFYPQSHVAVDLKPDGELLIFTLIPEDTHYIAGTVKNDLGEPVPGAEVQLSQQALDGGHVYEEAVTDSAGKFGFEGLMDTYASLYWQSKTGMARDMHQTGDVDRDDVELFVDRYAHVRGRVAEKATGEPLSVFTIIAKSDFVPYRDPWSLEKVFTNGEFDIEVIPRGTLTITAVVETYMESTSTPLRVKPGEIVEGMTFGLLPAENTQGSLRDNSTGEPVSRATHLAEQDYPRTVEEALAQIVNWETVTADSIEGEPHGTVVGRVLMPDNSPAAGATVSACSHRDHTMPFATTKADAAGRFQMSLPVGTCWFQARLGNYAGANGYCDAMLVVRAGGSAHEEIRLLKGCEVHGRVVDKATGAPVPGVLIVTYEGWRTVTDAEGRFRTAGVYTTDNAIFALKRGWHWPSVYFDTAGRDSVEVLVEMERGGTVSGKVTNERGLPMAGIYVDHGFSGSVWHCALRKTKTNSEGEYSLSGQDLEKGATVRVETDGYKIFYRKDIAFPPGEPEARFDIQLTATAEPRTRGGFGAARALQPPPPSRPTAATGHHWMEGRVVAPDGAPIAGALLIAGNVRRTTDADGRFRLENLPGGAVSVRVLKGHAQATAAALDVDRWDHVITLEPDGHVSGAVLWADTGEPVRRFKVLVTWPKNRKPDDLRNTGYQAAQHFGTTFNSPDGTFTVSALKSGSVNRVMVEVPGLRRVEKDRVIAQPVTRIEYSENIFYVNRTHTAYTFEGIVADKETGEGIEGVQVTMLELDSQTLDFFSWKNNPSPYRPVSVKTDGDGRFRFDTVRIRQGTLLIVKPGFARTMILDVDFRVPLNVALERGATICGTATNEAGRPLAGVDVRATNALQEHITFGSVKTDEDGRFSFADLPAGTYWVLQQDDGGSFGRHHRATISPGEMYTLDWDKPVFDPSSATPEDISMQEHLVGTWVRHTTASSGRKVRHIEYFRDDGSWEQKLFVEGNPRPSVSKGRFAVEDGKLIILYNNGGQVSWDVTSFDRSGRMVREIRRGAHTETMTKRI